MVLLGLFLTPFRTFCDLILNKQFRATIEKFNFFFNTGKPVWDSRRDDTDHHTSGESAQIIFFLQNLPESYPPRVAVFARERPKL